LPAGRLARLGATQDFHHGLLGPRARSATAGRAGRGSAAAAEGFTVVEALIAMAVTTALMGTVFALIVPARRALATEPEAADLHQRARVLVDTLRSDLLMAGAGTGLPEDLLVLGVAPVVPYRLGRERSGPRAGVHFTADTITVLLVPPSLEASMRTVRVGSRSLSLVSRTYYFKPTAARDGGQLMRYDGVSTELPVLDDVVELAFEYFGDPAPPRLVSEDLRGLPVPRRTTYGPLPPPPDVDDPGDEWGPGENCVFTVRDGRQEPRLPWLAAGPALQPLVPAGLTDGPWCAGTTPEEPYDADLLRVRRVRVHARLQARAEFRGPAGRLFARGGSARTAAQLVPDRELWFDVAPRNLTHGH
jgi:hypothetical protein